MNIGKLYGNSKKTVQDSLDENIARVDAWNDAHTESTYTKYKPALVWMWGFLCTSVVIWLKALFTGKMSLKNIGIVLAVSLPLYIVGYYVGIYVWAALGITIFYIGHTILFGTVLLLLPVNGIKFMFWMLIAGLDNSTTTTTTTYTTVYYDEDGNKIR